MRHNDPSVYRRLAAIACLTLAAATATWAQTSTELAPGQFRIAFDKAGITSLKHAGDQFDTDYIADEGTLGHVRVRYKLSENEWREFSTQDPKNKVEHLPDARSRKALQQLNVIYNPQRWIRNEYYADLELTERFRAEADALYWTIFLRNPTHKPIVLGDVFLPLPFNTSKRWDKTISYEQRVVQHQYISGHGSFLYWMRPNGAGPYLVMTPVAVCPLFEPTRSEMNFAPAKLEYGERGGVYILSGRRGEEDKARGGTWRQPQTTHTLTPTNSQRDGITFAFKFRWAKDLDGVRDILVQEGLLDVQVVPGMTLPLGSQAQIAIRTRSPIHGLEPEFAATTELQSAQPAGGQKDTHIYRVKFSKLGENKITVRFGQGLRGTCPLEVRRGICNQYAVLEFFVTEPIATLIRKRGAFLASRMQHRDPAKWYNGLFSEWDMKQKVLRGPDDTDGLAHYILASDDPALSKPVFLAAKNALYPDEREIASLEYYIENFVWGKLQMTREEPYPYGLYGIDNWKVNRESTPQSRDGWVDHLWRAYDYPHVTYFYWSMYQIAKNYPQLSRYANKDEYLERAYGTARGYYTYPWKFAGWHANELGNYNEMVIPGIIAELERVGWKEKAAELRKHWEGKVEYFINEQPDLFYSEYPFDPTGFESTGAFAHYAQEQMKNPQRALRVTPGDAQRFMDEQLICNISARGWLEPNYWQLGVEGNLRYMSQMGGWSVVDYALHHAPDPWPYLRLGYASLLSSWALMNTGTAESNYGYWYPGRENDGAAGSAYVPASFGSNWFGKQQPRGAWQYSGEIDLGFGAALRTTAVIVADDPIFGRIAYGGALSRSGGQTQVILQDGVGRRFHLLDGRHRIHLELDRDGFAAAEPIRFDDKLQRISFVIENRDPQPSKSHSTQLTVAGLPAAYEVAADGKPLAKIPAEGGSVALPIAEQATTVTLIRAR
ncbi:MAG: DUF5695 domain-containing protein [Candidatus Acidiferrales bacterium]